MSKPKPMTVEDVIKLLSKVENKKRHLCYVDGKKGGFGYFFASDQEDFDSEAIDNGPVHLELGGFP